MSFSFAYHAGRRIAGRHGCAIRSLVWAMAITVWMVVVVGYVLFHKLRHVYQWFENRFLSNLHDDVQKKHARKAVHHLAPWDAHITEFVIPLRAPMPEFLCMSCPFVKILV